jgi:ribulose-5-phosphate 4-epimerase/fuculose-1-phosphate aldolase
MRGKHVSKWQEEKNTVLQTALLMLEKRMVTGTFGNVSMRLQSEDGRELLAITPSSRYYDTLETNDIQVLDFRRSGASSHYP